jgi:peroxidase
VCIYAQRANGSCLEVITSLTFCEQNGCQKDPFNTNTGFLDTSSLYGSTKSLALQLRALTGGRMKTSAHNLLPIINSNFTGGDIRAIEHPALSVIHTLFVREHNRIAGTVYVS